MLDRLPFIGRFFQGGPAAIVEDRELEVVDDPELYAQLRREELAITRERARRALAPRQPEWMTHVPQYPRASMTRFRKAYRNNSVFHACINFYSRTFNRGILQVVDVDDVPTKKHPALALFRRPNPFKTPSALWSAFIQDAFTTGNGLFEKVHGVGSDRTVELWRLDPYRIAIEPHPRKYIRRYLYEIGGQWFPIPTKNVIHFAFPDPDEPYFGLPPILAASRSMAADDEAVDYLKVMLENKGTPPVVLEHEMDVTPGQARQAQRSYKRQVGGENRGKPLVIGRGTKAKVLGLSLRDMVVGEVIASTETRIAQVHGIPSSVLGRSGTQGDPTRTNAREAYALVWNDVIEPFLQWIAELLTCFLLYEFDPSGELRFRFDTSNVDVLQSARMERAKLAADIFKKTLVTRHHAQRLAGIPVHGDDEFFGSKDTP